MTNSKSTYQIQSPWLDAAIECSDVNKEVADKVAQLPRKTYLEYLADEKHANSKDDS